MKEITFREIIPLSLWVAVAAASGVFFFLMGGDKLFALIEIIVLASCFLLCLLWAILARKKRWFDHIVWALAGFSLASLILLGAYYELMFLQ